MKECWIVFSHLSGLAAFFPRSPKRAKLLDEICQRRLPRVAPTRRNFNARSVCTVSNKREELKELFEHIVDHHDDFDQDNIHSADGYITHLVSFEFCFLLSTFSSIFAHSDVLFGILQSREFDMQFCLNSVEDFCSTIKREGTLSQCTRPWLAKPASRAPGGHRHAETFASGTSSGVIDNLLTQLRDRFKDYERLMFLALIEP
ncbi:hypothetical protein AAFF_G00243610 [Aldrovandia affinis]|uniref:Uncharacterized protein n=1 Tax=Aldrovandia affinis TaxID=143900 RepID=A0AAD7RE14_9TELE|nr:hypothetical protein AAFF_G00243610 [Aldrovandia affinis]